MFIAIYCCDIRNGIGKNNKMPWVNKEELDLFKKITNNHNVFMGRKTFDSIDRKPLIGRNNFVISKTLEKANGITIINDLNDIFKYNDTKLNFIIGGKSIIEQTYKKCKFLFVSNLSNNYDCDIKLEIDYYTNFELYKIIQFKTFYLAIWKSKII
ncbi:dihydrofolate reductase [Malacoplasma muris]|uniref:dihydrofolate reductase n=1 Tax=Malacoplasma muris TaxID=2119 RepID=UPI00398ED8E7